MLRASSQATGARFDLRGVVDPTVDPLVPAGPELVAFTDAAVLHDVHEIDAARDALVAAAGTEAAARAATVAGNFSMMNRLLDGIGVGPHPSMLPIGDELGVHPPS